MNKRSILAATAMTAALAGCATAPLGPRVAVMPAPGKPLEVFAAEERACRQYADQSVGNHIEAVDNAAIGTAAVGTVIGAVAGAAIGGRQGAAVGAGTGLIVGSAAGSGRGAYTERDAQRRYDIAYQQCMYAKGNQLPGYHYAQPARAANYPPPPPSAMPPPPAASAPPVSAAGTIPPPPAGSPPPPPPGY